MNKTRHNPEGNDLIELDESDDFGFSFTDSSEIEEQAAHQRRADAEKLIGLRNMIMPLLNNLMKNPEKDTILWPNRKEKIQEFIKKMDKYIDS